MLSNVLSVDGLNVCGGKMNQDKAIIQAQEEKQRLILECQQLLMKIAKHRYSLKLLINAKSALELIAGYKPYKKIAKEGNS